MAAGCHGPAGAVITKRTKPVYPEAASKGLRMRKVASPSNVNASDVTAAGPAMSSATVNSRAAFLRNIAERRTFPAIDVQRTSTRKEELLLSKEELNKVYLLRNFLSDMPPVEAIEFLLERMKRSKTNQEFLDSMAGG